MRGLTAIDGVLCLIGLLLMVQMWLLSAALDAWLAGYREGVLPAAIVSALLFLATFALYRFVVRIDRDVHRPPR